MNPTNCCVVSIFKIKWYVYFQYYVQSAQAVPSTKVQASSMMANTILMTSQLTGGLYTGP